MRPDSPTVDVATVVARRAVRNPVVMALLLALVCALSVGPWGAAQATSAGASAAVHGFHGALIDALRQSDGKGFEARRESFTPVITTAFDSGFMAKVAAGRVWEGLTPEQREELTATFRNLTIANYASRFKSFTGQRFEVVSERDAPRNRVLVRSRLVRKNGEPVQIDYLLAHGADGGSWGIIDVWLDGTVSELALRRSEFAPVLRDRGFGGLIALLETKIADISKD